MLKRGQNINYFLFKWRKKNKLSVLKNCVCECECDRLGFPLAMSCSSTKPLTGRARRAFYQECSPKPTLDPPFIFNVIQLKNQTMDDTLSNLYIYEYDILKIYHPLWYIGTELCSGDYQWHKWS